MAERTYTVELRGKEIKITNQQLSAYRQMHIGNSELSERMSELIWLDMYVLDAEFGVSSFEILRSIEELEQSKMSSGIKPATQFKNMPLKGLWHKHYFSAEFLLNNIVLGLGKTGLEKLVNEVMDPKKSSIITQEMIDELARRITHEPVEKRAHDKKLTGEWIIYIRHANKNYYLCCNTHNAGDQFIYDRIVQNCVRDFPDFLQWLNAQQT